ncbi:MAG TPA: ATP-binding protein [Candidatus Acidoferrum sp.]|nr:ATP-binding protein [Candidatus Edwardsbacteria bacterium]HVM51408.1 ATP-binding protein [Candidatus Acidoferrum sp.]
MNYGLWQRLRHYGLRELFKAVSRFPSRAIELLKIPAPEAPQLIDRITLMERDIVLPLKVAGIAMLVHSFYFTPWFEKVLGILEIAVETTQYLLWIYIAMNVVVGAMLLLMDRVPLSLLSWSVFIMSLADGIFLSALTVVTGGYDSPLYWLFLALIVRGAVSVPRAISQIMLNCTLIACYVLAGLILIRVADLLEGSDKEILFGNTADNPAEPLVLRLVLLILMTVCCYGVQVLLDRQRRAVEEAREFAMREGQLQSAGRVAAEFTHQIKNPLAIINNAAYSIQRAVKLGKPVSPEQVGIIQEEVERSDRIITEIMGYASLAEGHVERLNVIEELDTAIQRVFPPAAGWPVVVHRAFGESFPPLLMQRRHLTESIINVLQNAREAMGDKGGDVWITARCLADLSVEVAIRDNGPGIPADKQGKIFEAYFTMKAKGTGLGLATVKHNVELYGGTIRVDSELGKGACFTLVFPAKALIKLAKRHDARSSKSET